MICALQDGHVKFLDDDFFDDEFGKYTAPVQLVKAEGKYVVFHVLEKECPLQIGDVILELDGQEIQEVANQRKQYCTLADKDRSTKNLVPYLLRSQNPQIKITVLLRRKSIDITGEGKYRRCNNWNLGSRCSISNSARKYWINKPSSNASRSFI